MNQPLLRLLFLTVILSAIVSACTKKPLMCCTLPDQQSIVGTWKWVGSDMGMPTKITPATGMVKTLGFDPQGSLTVVHNDKIGNDAILQMPTSAAINTTLKTDNGSFSIASQNTGCTNTSAVMLKAFGSQYFYTIKGDTLSVQDPGCVLMNNSYSYISYYVRQ